MCPAVHVVLGYGDVGSITLESSVTIRHPQTFGKGYTQHMHTTAHAKHSQTTTWGWFLNVLSWWIHPFQVTLGSGGWLGQLSTALQTWFKVQTSSCLFPSVSGITTPTGSYVGFQDQDQVSDIDQPNWLRSWVSTSAFSHGITAPSLPTAAVAVASLQRATQRCAPGWAAGGTSCGNGPTQERRGRP